MTRTEMKITLPVETKHKLKELADSNHRKMTGEIIALIEAAAKPIPTEETEEK